MERSCTAKAIAADALFRMNDAALCDFMTRHRLPGGNYELPVDDWEKLSEADRLHLAERLK